MAAIQGLFLTCIFATLAVAVVHGVPTPSPSKDCLDILLSDVKECLFYLREGSDAEKPSGSCCTGLNKVAETRGECICFAIKHAAGFGISVDMDRAAYLPSACGVTKDIKRSCRDVLSTSLPGSSPVYPPAFSPTPVLPPAHDSPIPAPSKSSQPPSPSVLSPELDSPIPAPPKSSESPSPSVLPPALDSPIPAPLKSLEPPSPSPSALPPVIDSPIPPSPAPDSPISAPPMSSEPPSPPVLSPAPDSPDFPIPAPVKSSEPPSPPAPPTSSEPPSPSPAPASPIPAPPSPSVLPPAAASPTAPPKSSEPSSPTSAPPKPAAPSGHSPAPEVENSAGYSISSFSVAVSAAAALLAFMFVVA